MIDQVDSRLKEWVTTTLGRPVTVCLSSPAGEHSDCGVHLFLFELRDDPPARGSKRPPLQVLLRYLVTTWASAPEDAHRMLGELLFAAMADSEFQVELEPVSAALWSALGASPQPSFILRVPVRVERPEPDVQYVRHPLVVRSVLTRALQGVVLTPEDVPVAGATVELPTLSLATRTDANGQFLFPTIPTEPPVRQLCVKAKGREVIIPLDASIVDRGLVVIRFHAFDV